MSASLVSPHDVGDQLAAHYTETLQAHGPNAQGMDWPNTVDLEVRFGVLTSVLDACESARPSVLDLGCGAGLLVDHLKAAGRWEQVDYRGVDLAPAMIPAARGRLPGVRFEVRDVLADPLPAQSVDVVILNGVLTERRGVDHASMEAFAQAILTSAYGAARVGVAFNVMSTHVDWMREDLFHWPMDAFANFAVTTLTRHIAVRADYGLYEYAGFLFREPRP